MNKLKKYTLGQLNQMFTNMTEEELSVYFGGGTTYKFDKKGHMVTEENNFEYNVVCVGSVSQIYDGTLSVSSYICSDGTRGDSIQGANIGLFKFLADNTNVEWGAFYKDGLDAPSSRDCLLQTTHQRTVCQNRYDENAGYTSYMHSHPKQEKYTYSSEDAQAWRQMVEGENNTIGEFGIYSDGYIRDYSDDVMYDRLIY